MRISKMILNLILMLAVAAAATTATASSCNMRDGSQMRKDTAVKGNKAARTQHADKKKSVGTQKSGKK